jgi:uncharacterized membrane protein
MRSEWNWRIACGAAQIAALAGLAAWLLAAPEVPYRAALRWLVPALGLWAGLAGAGAAACLAERRRLRRESKISIRWEEIRP